MFFCLRGDIYHNCCMTVINRGALPQGQPGAAATVGVKGQKVSGIGGRRSLQCLGLLALQRLCSREKQREGQWRIFF